MKIIAAFDVLNPGALKREYTYIYNKNFKLLTRKLANMGALLKERASVKVYVAQGTFKVSSSSK